MRDVIVTLVLVLVSCLGFFFSFVCCHALCWRVCGHRLEDLFSFFLLSLAFVLSLAGSWLVHVFVCFWFCFAWSSRRCDDTAHTQAKLVRTP